LQIIKCDVCKSSSNFVKTKRKFNIPKVPITHPIEYEEHDIYFCNVCGNEFLIKNDKDGILKVV